MKSLLHIGFSAAAVVAVTVSSTQAAHAPDRGGCRSTVGYVQSAAKYLAPTSLVAEADTATTPPALGSDTLAVSNDVAAPTGLNI